MRETNREFIETWPHSPGRLEKGAGVWVVNAGKSTAKPNYSVGPQVKTHYCVHFIVEGNLRFTQGEFERVLGQGDSFFLLSGMRHKYQIESPGKPLRLLWINLAGTQVEDLLSHIGITADKPYLKNALSNAVIEIFDRICSLVTKKNPYGGLNLLGLLYELFGHLQGRAQPEALRKEQTDWIRIGMDYMNLHYPEGIMVKDVVQYLGVDRSYFTRTFTEKLGMNPKRYLQRIRMAKSAKMLEETAFSVSEVASSVGFADLFSFTRAFTKHHGVSPLKYRQTCKEGT